MKTLARILCVVLLAAAGACHSAKQAEPRDAAAGKKDAVPPPPGWVVTGTVRHIDVEGGFYGIATDEGAKLDPVNLPDAFKQDGLRVRARVERVEGGVSSHMWGAVVNVLEIARL